MKAREVMAALRGRVDPEVVKVCVGMAEDISALKQVCNEQAQLIGRLAELMTVHTHILDDQQKFAKQIEKHGVRVASEDPTKSAL